MLKSTSTTLPSPTSISSHTTSRSTSRSRAPAPATKITIHYDIGGVKSSPPHTPKTAEPSSANVTL
ncbi:hypothetical protein TorRG33x02_210820 [Trema orientale]|uniref:Uncharacterized protein n=1 Tax=Trema orientale TaxID=63057 RepID=A0A2P5EC35_TREOI|nr:hypothetical protein TorRG33x02_210820 [Trema orientale]